jgi:predicted transcriptional regulator
MPRLTITLSEERHRALKEAAARRRKSIAAIIEESLEQSGVKTTEAAIDLVARARSGSGLEDAGALELAVEETRAQKDRR